MSQSGNVNLSEHPSDKPSKIFHGVACTMAMQLYILFRSYLDMVIDAVYGFFWDGAKKELPALEKRHSILAESAMSLAAMIRDKKLKSEELVQACIERINLVNPILNAMTDQRFEDALKEAREIDRKIEEGLSEEFLKEKPFLGVPFTAKESHAVRGMRHTLGIKARAHLRADADAECVRLMRRAGAVPIAVTNVPEINKWQETVNLVFGRTNNPYHAGRTTGGSSGGEAALCAAFGSPISLCSDIGGSTRMPAFYCGLFGLNPTAGHTSLKGSVLRSGLEPTMASIGFVSRHLSDLAPLTKVVAGDKAGDLALDRHIDLKDIQYYYVESAPDLRVSPIYPEMRSAMNKVLSFLSPACPRPYGHAALGHMYSLWRHAMTLEAEDFSRVLTDNKGRAGAWTELAKKLLGQSEYSLAAVMKLCDDQLLPPVDRQWAERLTADLKHDLLSTLGDRGVLVFPSAPAPAPAHGSLYVRPYNFAYWAVLNVLHFPAVQVPLGLSPAGLPLGVQVAAAPRQEALALAAAAHVAAGCGGFTPPCAVDA